MKNKIIILSTLLLFSSCSKLTETGQASSKIFKGSAEWNIDYMEINELNHNDQKLMKTNVYENAGVLKFNKNENFKEDEYHFLDFNAELACSNHIFTPPSQLKCYVLTNTVYIYMSADLTYLPFEIIKLTKDEMILYNEINDFSGNVGIDNTLYLKCSRK